MITASDALGKSGGYLTYNRANGQTIQVQPLTFKIMSKYEKWLESKALESCIALKNVDSKLFREAFTSISQEITRGAYAFGGELAQDSLQTSSGIAQLISIMCNITTDLAMELATQDGDGFRSVLDLAIKQSLPQKDDESGNENPAPTA